MITKLFDSPVSQLVEQSTQVEIAEERITLSPVTWAQYETLRSLFDNLPSLRITYLSGILEMLMPSPQHERLKSVIARLIETYSLETNTRLYCCGSTTYRKQAKESGLEPDESYCVGEIKDLPDFAIEVTITSGSIDKLKVYQELGIPEVWFWEKDRLMLYQLRNDGYTPIDRSQFLPSLDLNLLVRAIKMSIQSDQFDALLQFRNALR